MVVQSPFAGVGSAQEGIRRGGIVAVSSKEQSARIDQSGTHRGASFGLARHLGSLATLQTEGLFDIQTFGL